MSFDLGRRQVLVGLGVVTTWALAGCAESDRGHTTYEIDNERSTGVSVGVRMYDRNELVLAKSYELGPDENRREENALAGTEYDVEVTVGDEAETYTLEPNGCEDQELGVRIGDDSIDFEPRTCE